MSQSCWQRGGGGGWRERRLTQEEAARLLGVCERTFRRHVDRRYEDLGRSTAVRSPPQAPPGMRNPVKVISRSTLNVMGWPGQILFCCGWCLRGAWHGTGVRRERG